MAIESLCSTLGYHLKLIIKHNSAVFQHIPVVVTFGLYTEPPNSPSSMRTPTNSRGNNLENKPNHIELWYVNYV